MKSIIVLIVYALAMLGILISLALTIYFALTPHIGLRDFLLSFFMLAVCVIALYLFDRYVARRGVVL